MNRRAAAALVLTLTATGCGSRVSPPVLQARTALSSPAAVTSSPQPSATPPLGRTATPSATSSPPAAPAAATPTPRRPEGPAPAATSPGLRVHAAALPVADGVLVYGGAAPAGGPWRSDTWHWDGHRWARVASDGPATPYGPGLGSDPVTGLPVLLAGGALEHEGSSDPAYALQTWRWTGHGWAQLHPAHALVAGQVQSTVADPARHRLLVWVGTSAGDMSQGGTTNQTASAQMWAWDGTDWTRLYAHTADPDQADPTLAVPGPDGQVYGVGLGTYRWTGTGWQQLQGTGAPASVTQAAYDPERHVVVAVGARGSSTSVSDQGVNDDGTYLFDGRRWVREALPAPIAHRAGPVMAWDVADHAVLFGYGQEGLGFIDRRPTGYDDSWVLAPDGWRQRTR